MWTWHKVDLTRSPPHSVKLRGVIWSKFREGCLRLFPTRHIDLYIDEMGKFSWWVIGSSHPSKVSDVQCLKTGSSSNWECARFQIKEIITNQSSHQYRQVLLLFPYKKKLCTDTNHQFTWRGLVIATNFEFFSKIELNLVYFWRKKL